MLSFENNNIEFKQEYVDNVRKDIIAFANAEGGTVYIGIRKDGSTVGVEDPDDVMLRISSSLKDSVAPDIMPFIAIKTVQSDGKNVVEITVATGTNRPYYIREKGLKPSGVYVRKGSSSQPMTDDGIREMIRQTGGKSYEESRSLKQDLTFETFAAEMGKRNLEHGRPQMQTLNLIGEDGLYTNLAYLLSDQCESVTKVAFFQGTDKAVFRDRKEFSGSILRQLEEVYHYIDLTNKTKASFSGLNRIDVRDYPEEAIREALLNTIVHRDYSYSGSNLINIYDDRIEFVSIGGLVQGLSLESIFLGISASRNPNLAQLFFRMHLIESYGTGIGKIQRNYIGVEKQPIFETAPGVFRATLPNVNEAKSSQSDLQSAPLSQSTETDKGITDSNLTRRDKILHEKDLIVEYATENGHITRKDAEEMLGIGTTKAFRLLKELCADGKLKSVGVGKSMKYVINS